MEDTTVDAGATVDLLTDYFKHLTTVSGGAIAFVATFAGNLRAAGGASGLAFWALVSLGACVVSSTLMMWTYGVARREAASAGNPNHVARWAFAADGFSKRLARVVVRVGALASPLTFVAGFVLLALYALDLLST